MLCALRGLTTKYSGEKARYNDQFITRQILRVGNVGDVGIGDVGNDGDASGGSLFSFRRKKWGKNAAKGGRPQERHRGSAVGAPVSLFGLPPLDSP